MAGKKISQLPQANSFSIDSLLPIVSGSVTYKTTVEDLNILEKTKAQMDSLSGSNGFIPGQLYKITGVDTALYGGTDILIKAATTNKLELAGHGVFYNPKYLNSQLTPNNGYGIWSNYITLTFSNIVGTFTNGDTVTANNGATATYLAQGFLSWISGNWSAATSISNGSGATANVTGGVSPSYAIGQDVIWGGKHWTNTSGNVGTATNKYTLSSADWTAVPFNSTDYNVDIDVIHYDYLHDMIIRRKDKWNNDVDGNFQVFDEFSSPDGYDFGNPIKDFQWGNGPEDWTTDEYYYIGVQSNLVKDSYFECINFVGEYLWFNTLTEQSYMLNNIGSFTHKIYYNVLSRSSFIQNNTIATGFIQNNTLFSSNIIDNRLSSGVIGSNTLNNSNISENILNNSNINANTITYSSVIRNNILNSESYINNNILINESSIINNLLSSGFIEKNNLDSSTFDFSPSGTLTKVVMHVQAQNANATFNISSATVITSSIPSKYLFRNISNQTKLGYYNTLNVFTVVNVNA
jgi:hypothetical protein